MCVCVSLRPELCMWHIHPPRNSDWFRNKKVIQFGPMRVRPRLPLLHWEDPNILLFRSLRTNSSQLSKHVKHFHTSVLLQMLFYSLNEWRKPPVIPYVILAWIPKPYATIFNLISMYSLLLYQTIFCLISNHSSLLLPTVPPLFPLSSSSKIWVALIPPSTWVRA